MPIIPTLQIYTSKDVRMQSYFSNTTGFRKEEGLGNTAISFFLVRKTKEKRYILKNSVF